MVESNYYVKYQKYKNKYLNLHKEYQLKLSGGSVPTPVDKIKTIVLMRHGEKPEPHSHGQLNCQGFNRAIRLGPLLLKRFGIPDEIYAPKPTLTFDNQWYIRPIITIEPYAILANKQVNVKYDFLEQNRKELAKELFDAPAGTYVISWEHHLAIDLLSEIHIIFGHKFERFVWPDDDYDRLYILTYNYTTNVLSMKQDKQGLDNMSTECRLT